VAVYGNPGPVDSGKTDAFGIEWHPFWAYDEENRPGVFVVWWHHLDAVDIGRRAHMRFHWSLQALNSQGIVDFTGNDTGALIYRISQVPLPAVL
jgi:hypothetical protein